MSDGDGNHTRCVVVVVNSGELFTAVDSPGPLSESVRELWESKMLFVLVL